MTMTTMLSELEEELQKILQGNMQRNLNLGFMDYILKSPKMFWRKNRIEWYDSVIAKDIDFLRNLRD